MALITDPDLLTDSAADDSSTEIFIDTANKLIKLNPGVGNLVAADGVTEKAVYSFLKEEWINDPHGKNYAAFPWPFENITDEFFELIDGWNWANAATRQSIRQGGWLVRNTSGNVTEHWAAISALSAEADDQLYYDQGAGATAFTFSGPISEAVQVINDPNGDGNYADGYDRSGTFAIYNREQAQLYAQSDLSAIGVTDLLAPKVFSFPVPTGVDLNITTIDTGIDADTNGAADVTPYDGMSITFHAVAQSRTIGATSRDFGIIIDGNSGTKQQIYEFVQWSLRQANDQDAGAGSLVGQLMPELLEFVGDTLKTKTAVNYQGGGTGVYIDNFQPSDTNSLVFVDNTDTERTFPFVSVVTLNFNANLQNDPAAEYSVYFTDGVTGGLEWGNSGAILVDDDSGSDVSGLVSGNAQIQFDFDYDGNNQGGRTPGTNANITVIAIGLDNAQYVRATGEIARSTENSVSLVSAIERQYENP